MPGAPALRRLANWGLFVGWLAIVLWFVVHHAMWRDEVRALQMATAGPSPIDVFRAVRGDGHPILWHLTLWAGHPLLGRLVLPIAALLIGAGAALLIVFRSPFNWFEKAALLFAKFFVFDYAVVARNYGISMLLMFAFAALYRRWRTRGIGLGVALFLLCNTNVHSVVLAGALMGFWILDVVREHGLRLGAPQRLLLVNAGLAALGVLTCALTVYPPIHDALGAPTPTLAGLVGSLLNPGPLYVEFAYKGVPLAIVSVLLVLAVFSAAEDLAGLAAAAVSYVGMTTLFYVLYGGSYRHEALLLALFVALIWIRRAGPPRSPAAYQVWPARIGYTALALLLLMQDLSGARFLRMMLTTPVSRSRDLAELIKGDVRYQRATVIADPDYLVEALPYYAPNPVYLIRERRPGPLVVFTKRAILDLSLDDVLAKARQLAAERHAPVLILLNHELSSNQAASVREGYNWTFNTTPEQVARFRAATRFVKQMGPALSDETFAVYELPATGSAAGN